MLIFLRWVLRVFKKEQVVLARYERSHPHFLWFLALDALLSVALVVGGYQLFLTNSSSAESREPQEMAAISSSALVSKATVENLDTFWLGPVADDKYTVDDHEAGIVDILYWPGGSGNDNPNAYLYEVKTYERQDVWDAHTHPIKANINTTTFKVSKTISIKINESSMKGEIVTFTDKPEIVAIGYPKRQTLGAMKKNAESLKLLR